MYSMEANCMTRCIIFAIYLFFWLVLVLIICYLTLKKKSSYNLILLLKHDGKYYSLPSDAYS